MLRFYIFGTLLKFAMRIFCFNLMMLVSGVLFAQKQHFVPPLEIPPAFSGTFGEIRADHFHSGVDLRTMGRSGFNVFAVESGFVSRIKVSPVGFGKTVYIDHPNGKTTVYAHLDEFVGKIAEYVENAQYQKQSFEIELFPNPNELFVNQGDIIGISGNSGSSGGPHLHFEVRETASQRILDPFDYFDNWKNTDSANPTINRLLVFEIDSIAYLQSNLTFKSYALIKKGHEYTLSSTVLASGKVGFAVDYYDPVNPNSLKAGIKKAELLVNGCRIFAFNIDKFSFSETRYANGFNGITDTGWNGYKAMRLWIDPNNAFTGVRNAINGGIIQVAKDSIYSVEITLWDHSDNSSKLAFKLKGSDPKPNVPPLTDSTVFRWNVENTYRTDNYRVTLPEKSLFHDILFRMTEKASDGLPYPIVTVHTPKTKLLKKFTLEFDTQNIPEYRLSKLYIAKINGKGFEYVGSELTRRSIKATCNSFGNYTVLADTIAPSIIVQNFLPNEKNIDIRNIIFKLIDNTGIQTYKGYIDDSWVLFEWDPKTGILSHNLKPNRVRKGQWHSLKIVVTDLLGNRSEYVTKFFW